MMMDIRLSWQDYIVIRAGLLLAAQCSTPADAAAYARAYQSLVSENARIHGFGTIESLDTVAVSSVTDLAGEVA